MEPGSSHSYLYGGESTHSESNSSDDDDMKIDNGCDWSRTSQLGRFVVTDYYLNE